MIRIVVADDHELIREGLKRLLKSCADMQLCGEATTGEQTLALVEELRPNVLLLDMAMPGIAGLELIKRISVRVPSVRILVVSMHPEERYAVRAIQAGAAGFVNKAAASAELLGAIRLVSSGQAYLSPTAAQSLAQQAIGLRPDAGHEKLSAREFQVLELLVSGRSVTDIGAHLHVSVKTVSTHKSRILEKLNLESFADLMRYAMDHGLIDSAAAD